VAGHEAGAGYRPYCDPCGDKLVPFPITLHQARLMAQAHANRERHTVRVEPWDSYNLIEAVEPAPVPGGLGGV
jgi:hypothetical protein